LVKHFKSGKDGKCHFGKGVLINKMHYRVPEVGSDFWALEGGTKIC